MNHQIKAVIFDLDGTLINSEVIGYDTYRRYLKEKHGYHYSAADHCKTIGYNDNQFIEVLENATGLDIDGSDMISSVRGSHNYQNIALKPGTIEVLKSLKDHPGIKIVLATNTKEDRLLKKIGHLNIIHFFDHIITGDKIINLKPAPDIYNLAAETIGCHPDQCLVIEDSESGVQAALSAGCQVIYVPHSFIQHPEKVVEKYHVQLCVDLNQVRSSLEQKLSPNSADKIKV